MRLCFKEQLHSETPPSPLQRNIFPLSIAGRHMLHGRCASRSLFLLRLRGLSQCGHVGRQFLAPCQGSDDCVSQFRALRLWGTFDRL